MRIDAETGEVHLSNGLMVSADLTPEQLLAARVGAKPYNHNALPFDWYSSEGGEVNDEPLRVEFCFHEGALVHADFHLDLLLDPLPLTMAHLEERSERADATYRWLLRRDLRGKSPVRQHDFRRGASRSSLEVYRYPWGEVQNCVESNHFIRVEYASRRVEARKTYPKMNVPDNLSAAARLRERLGRRAG